MLRDEDAERDARRLLPSRGAEPTDFGGSPEVSRVLENFCQFYFGKRASELKTRYSGVSQGIRPRHFVDSASSMASHQGISSTASPASASPRLRSRFPKTKRPFHSPSMASETAFSNNDGTGRETGTIKP